jgi:hypothetical protein
MLTIRYRTLALAMVIPLLLVAMFFVGVLSASALTDNCFTDVTTGMWFHDYVCWMFDEGLTTGFPDGTYRPAEYVNRAQMAVFLQQMSGDGSAGPIVNADRLNDYFWYDFAPAGLGYERVTDSTSVGAGTLGTIMLTCPTGKAVLSGGAWWDSTADAYLVSSYSAADNSWQVKGFNDSGFAKTFTAHALCADLTP